MYYHTTNWTQNIWTMCHCLEIKQKQERVNLTKQDSKDVCKHSFNVKFEKYLHFISIYLNEWFIICYSIYIVFRNMCNFTQWHKLIKTIQKEVTKLASNLWLHFFINPLLHVLYLDYQLFSWYIQIKAAELLLSKYFSYF